MSPITYTTSPIANEVSLRCVPAMWTGSDHASFITQLDASLGEISAPVDAEHNPGGPPAYCIIA